LVESLLLSELFGHERGSFTGAHQRKVGRFEMAAGGTIFLDEIGDISPKTQVALLRVLQEKEFERVGGGRCIKLQARVVCATNRNLLEMVRNGTFREDLYYRLKGITIELPPLRDRPEDVERLATHFLAQYAIESGSPSKELSVGAGRMLRRYAWPGNIRELENVLRSVALFADAEVINVQDFHEYRELFEDSPQFEPEETAGHEQASIRTLPTALPDAPAPEPRSVKLRAVESPEAAPEGSRPPEEVLLTQIFDEGVPLAELKQRLQDEAIAHALRRTGGNITRAAEMLGMKRPRLSQIINANSSLKGLCQGGVR
jgi:sigma-54 specific flagellar transcriptional regulator A